MDAAAFAQPVLPLRPRTSEHPCMRVIAASRRSRTATWTHTTCALQDADPHELDWTPAIPSGTLAHMLRASPAHLPTAVHDVDGDGYVLALTTGAPGSAPFARGRYIRTRAYMRELRTQRRLYTSRGGTPVPDRRFRRVKRACADGLVAWGGRLFARGERGLPVWLDASTLVSRGYSALGAALTDRDEMARERGASLVVPPIRVENDCIALCARGSSPERIFFSESAANFSVSRRLPALPFPKDADILDFRVSASCYVVLLAYTRPAPASAFFKNAFEGDSPSPPLMALRGTAVAVAMRDVADGARASISIVNLPASAFCMRLAGVVDEGEIVRVDAVELLEVADELTIAQLSDVGIAASAKKGTSSVLSSFLVDPVAGTAERVGTSAGDQVSVHSISPCGRFATVVDAKKRRAGIAAVDGTRLLKMTWAEEDGATVSGVVASPDGTVVSALISSNGMTKVQFWNADNLDVCEGCELEFPESRFGEIMHSCGAVWDEMMPKYPEGGKVVKSAYEIFDDRNWNDINSGFSSLGINQ